MEETFLTVLTVYQSRYLSVHFSAVLLIVLVFAFKAYMLACSLPMV